ncbi:globin [Deinococcus cavernae]|uniref:Globin n=1 Tax=Deinococcus cavernae TaxID=2320857 RepID=A0A418VAU4_9DEIO|nr:globin [Deinococcus cavernae]RJF73223.1 globin [Deinococcus cavernae]
MTAPIPLDPAGPLYDRIGAENLHLLIGRFYARVGRHPELIPIFPANLTLTAQKQEAFLTGFLGGPPLYHQQYGHPRLRARHLPFQITPARARAWLACMREALRETPEIGDEDARELYAALNRVAVHMVNSAEAEG